MQQHGLAIDRVDLAIDRGGSGAPAGGARYPPGSRRIGGHLLAPRAQSRPWVRIRSPRADPDDRGRRVLEYPICPSPPSLPRR
jgi:hypothetical protein